MSENGEGSTIEWDRSPKGVMHTSIGTIPVMAKEVQGGKWIGVFNGWSRAFDDMDTAMGETVFMANILDTYMDNMNKIFDFANKTKAAKGIIREV